MTAPDLVAAGLAHAPVIAALQAECGPEAWTAGAIARILELPGAYGFVAAADDSAGAEPLGYILCRAVADEAEVLAVGVRGTHRRRGCGRRLMEAALARAAELAVAHMFLEVAEDNAAARRLYAAAGFAEAGRRRGYYRRPGGPRVDALILRRRIAGADETIPCG